MKKALLLANTGLGDHVALTMPLAREIHKTHKVHCLTHNKHGYRIIRHLSCLESCIQTNNLSMDYLFGWELDEKLVSEKLTDVARLFSNYDKVYVALQSLYERLYQYVDNNLLSNVVQRMSVISYYRPAFILKAHGFPEGDADRSLDINLFCNYYKDFNCNHKTIILNGQSSSPLRTYDRIKEVAKLLSSQNFDVRFMNENDDIRTNLHLLNQSKYVLTTDTSTYWLAKSIGKEPHVFLCKATYKQKEDAEEMLGTKNLVQNIHSSLNQISPEEIVEGFINRINVSLL